MVGGYLLSLRLAALLSGLGWSQRFFQDCVKMVCVCCSVLGKWFWRGLFKQVINFEFHIRLRRCK